MINRWIKYDYCTEFVFNNIKILNNKIVKLYLIWNIFNINHSDDINNKILIE